MCWKVLDTLTALFKDADADMSGYLDTEELSKVLYDYYKQSESTSRPRKKVVILSLPLLGSFR